MPPLYIHQKRPLGRYKIYLSFLLYLSQIPEFCPQSSLGLKLRGGKDFGAPACSDTVRGKNSNEPAAASDLGLNFNFSNHKIELSRLNLTPRDGKILTPQEAKISSAATASNRCTLNFRYRDYAHELAFFELFDL